jgi:branched-chain amino acid transport system permease protein
VKIGNNFLVSILFFCAGFALIFAFSNNFYITFILTLFVINLIFGLSQNIITGYVGQLSFATAGLAGIGAYTSAFLSKEFSLPLYLTVPTGSLLSALVGIGLTFPSLRLKGFYFAFSTVIVQALLSLVYRDLVSVTGGDVGLPGIPTVSKYIGEQFLGFPSSAVYLLLVFITCFIVLIFTNKLLNSKTGYMFTGIREDYVLLESLGANVTKYKVIAFFLSSLFAGLGGALYAHLTSYVFPLNFNLAASITILLLISFGGRGSVMGTIIGATFVTFLPYAVTEIYPYRDFIYGILFIVIIRFAPRGVAGALKNMIQKLKVSEK